MFLLNRVQSGHFSYTLTICRFKQGQHMYSDASIIADCPGCERWRRARIARLNCSGIASLLSIKTQLFVTAAFDQNCAIYIPNLLKDCTSLLMIAVLIGPRNWSFPVTSASRSTSKKSGKPTTVPRDEGFVTVISMDPHLNRSLLSGFLGQSPPPAFVEEMNQSFQVVCPRANTKWSLECLNLALLRARIMSILVGWFAEPDIEGAYRWWIGARKLGEDVLKFSTKFKKFACSRVLLARSTVLTEEFEVWRLELFNWDVFIARLNDEM